jgi:transcriptional regulator with PAS, ATPase and Fis domain
LRNNLGKIVGGIETFRDLSQVETLRRELERRYTFDDMIGRSRQMQEMFELIPIVAPSDSTVLIEGESGTGKELVARAIHHLSNRHAKPIIGVVCGAIPDTLLESELFGYKAGAFTDAKRDKKGRFALAEGGTLFLDEVGDISPALQVKLLRVLQEHEYVPLGNTISAKTDVRIIAATNHDLIELMQSGEFREDLYYRLNVFRIKVPPLRERMVDVPLLINHFIGKFNHLRNKDISGITPQAQEPLMKHSFPGNVRELENIVEHAFVLCPGGVIRPEHLPAYIHEAPPIPAVEIAGSLEEMEALFLTAALKRNNWSRQDTAHELGINPSTLYRKIKKLGLTFPSYRSMSGQASD